MFGHSARILVVCTLTVIGTACAEGAGPARENAQPGETCRVTNDCAIGFNCVDDACRQTEPYRITLTWNVDTDFDLHVRTNDGVEAYFGRANRYVWLTGDSCPSEMCREGETTHAEHALLIDLKQPDDLDATAAFPNDEDAGDLDGSIPRGIPTFRYEYWVDNYGCQKAGDFTLEVVAANDTVIERRTGTLEARCMESEHFVTPLLPFPQE